MGIFRITSRKIIAQVTTRPSLCDLPHVILSEESWPGARKGAETILTRSSQPVGSLGASPDSEEELAP